MGGKGYDPHGFPTTHWSRIAIAGGEGEERARALEELLRRYLPALRAHLVLHNRVQPECAEDILQEFVTDKVLQKNLIARADQRKGKFRTFLLTALERFAIDRFRKEAGSRKAAVRPAGKHDGAGQGILVAPFPPAAGVAWAREVVARARDRLEQECKASRRSHIWEIFWCRVLGPELEGIPPVRYRELIARTGVESPAQAANLLVTAKRMFARHIRDIVGEYAIDDEEVGEEIEELKEMILADSRAGSGRKVRT